jgi:hypothetical protein
MLANSPVKVEGIIMKTSTGFIVAMALAATTASAQDAVPTAGQDAAVCAAPERPAVERPVKPLRPAAPGCVDEARHRHTCSNRVIGQYNAALDAYGLAFTAYVDSVNAYSRKLAGYADGVNEYVRCEHRIVMPSTLIEG